MTVGFIGLGKLGMSTCIAIADRGHRIVGHDTSPTPWVALNQALMPTIEPSSQSILDRWKKGGVIGMIVKVTLADMAKVADLIFIAVPTPHDPDMDGTNPLGPNRADFSYHHLIGALDELVIEARGKAINVAVVSTVLPGTMRRDILSRVPGNVGICYNPLFAGMGTVVEDVQNPEFVLIGAGSVHTANLLERFWQTIHNRTVHVVGLEEAETIKMAYNTFIGLKIGFANLLGELCHKIGANVDTVTRVLCDATDRLISSKYLRASGGDGGPCHPRDQIAMSYLARKEHLSYDLFGEIMLAREAHANWIADLLTKTGLPIQIMGRAFKSESNLTDGSWSLLLQFILQKRGVAAPTWDPLIDPPAIWAEPTVFLIAVWHRTMIEISYPPKSVVFDLVGHCPVGGDQVQVIKLGRQD